VRGIDKTSIVFLALTAADAERFRRNPANLVRGVSHFDVSIPDNAAEEVLGTDDWTAGMKNVTVPGSSACGEAPPCKQRNRFL
jgi:hypothetical protein